MNNLIIGNIIALITSICMVYSGMLKQKKNSNKNSSNNINF